MKAGDGSTGERMAFVQRVPADSSRSAPTAMRSFTTKRVLAVAGVTLVVGSAVVAYVETYVPAAAASRDAASLTLAAAQHVSGDDALLQGVPFQLRIDEKQLCMDDGGGTSSGDMPFVLAPCDAASANQVFTYDAETHQMRSVAKPSLCVDDGGGWHNGETKFHFSDCDPDSINQKLVYLAETQQFQSMYKTNKCMDDGGGDYAGQTPLHLWDCFAETPNQRFHVVPVQSVPSYPVPNYLQHGEQIVIFVADKPGMCVDDGGGWGNGDTTFRDGQCNGKSEKQVFVFDPDHAMFRSAVKRDLCLDDGGARAPGDAQFHLWACDVDNVNQRYIYEEATQHIRNPVKDVCMDSAGGVYTTQPCSSASSQSYSILWASEVAGLPEGPSEITETDMSLPAFPPVDHPILASTEEFMMRVPSKANLCVDDGGGRINGETKFRLWTCDPSDVNQIFRYDPTTYLIHSSVKGGMCVDDGGGLSNGQSKFHLWQCDASNVNQKFVYDWSSERFYNPHKPNMCMDDGNSFSAGDTQMHLWQCDVNNRNQHFELVPRTAFGVPVPPPVEMPGLPMPDRRDDANAIFVSGKSFMLRQLSKENACLGYGPQRADGAILLALQECDPASPSVQFVYDMQNGLVVRSVLKPTLCVDDGWGGEEQKVQLMECDMDSYGQKFTYDPTTMTVETAMRNRLCIDDNGSEDFAHTQFELARCDPTKFTQKFEVVSVDALQETAEEIPGGLDYVETKGPAEGVVVPDQPDETVVPDAMPTPDAADEPELPEETVVPGAIPPPDTVHEPEQPDEAVLPGDYEETVSPETMLPPDGADEPELPEEAVLPDGYQETEVPQAMPPLDATNEPELPEETVVPGAIPPPDTVDEPSLPDENDVSSAYVTVEPPPMDGPGDMNKPENGDTDTLSEPTVSTNADKFDGEQVNSADAADPRLIYENSIFDEGDWNLLAPSNTTIAAVNADRTDDVTSGEIFAYLLGLKDTAETTYVKMLSKYDRTSECVNRGLQSLAKTALTVDEYHALVKWMHEHCIIDAKTPEPIEPTDDGEMTPDMPPSDEITRVFMTKLEFYERIKDHFAHEHEALLGSAESVRLGSHIAMTKLQKLHECSYEASNRFGREKEYELLEHFHNAIQWISNECLNGPAERGENESVPNEDTAPDMMPVSNHDTRTFMTKLEFYHRIKGHFAREHGELFGETESVRLRSEGAAAKRQELLRCIDEASSRFGREREYEQPEHFHNALQWINNECMTATP